MRPSPHRILRRAESAPELSDANALRAAVIRLSEASSLYARVYATKNLFQMAHALTMNISKTRLVPKKWKTTFEKARRTFSSSRKIDVLKWYESNQDVVDMLLTSDDWDAVSEENSVTIGRFRVVDGTGSDGAIEAVRKAVGHMEKSGVPGLSKAMYGEVRVVGRVRSKDSIMAQYFHQSDLIEILNKKKFAGEQVRSFIHEVGHRYWNKFLDKDVQSLWRTHHTAVTLAKTDYTSIKVEVGTIIPTKKGDSRIVKIENGIVHAENGGRYDHFKLLTLLMKWKRLDKFPTPYSATSMEEHFCESLSMYCIGTLTGGHLEAFERIIIQG